MNKRSRPKLSESDLELFNRVVADVKPLKFQEKSFIDKKNSINRMVPQSTNSGRNFSRDDSVSPITDWTNCS